MGTGADHFGGRVFHRKDRSGSRVAGWGRMASIAGVMLLAAGCGVGEQASDPGLGKFYKQSVEWGPCQDFSVKESAMSAAGIECARVTVPLDYDEPDGGTARIAISRLAARGERVASLLTNPGGPGGRGIITPLIYAESPLAQRFDLIGIDVRGLGASTPKVECLTPEERLAERADLDVDYSAAGIAQTEREEQDLVAKCVERSGVELLSHIGTREVVRDFDIVRAVLGDEKLSYWGQSYGTRIGSMFAETYPDRVRAMVLDGPVDPGTNILDPVISARSFQLAFETYAADCVTKPDCPLGTDPAPAQTSAALRALMQPLIDRPAATADSRGLSYRDALSGVLNSLYSPEQWADLTTGLTELRQGRGDALLAVADRIETSGFIERDQQQAVFCVDDRRVTDRAEAAELARRATEAAPAFDDGRGTGQTYLDVCAFWPVPATSQPHVPTVSGLPETVVIATTGDPATPYEGGVNLARALGSTLITFEGNQHGVFGSGVACVDAPVIEYLVNLTPPAEGLRCTAG
ncbi:alpha/beta hydrolase [Nocardia sp. NPDC127526]|uniref:alpha/beta hydrolase n=1 Tax=Nocardia sp. NPDC127526 TaxID=3345393 RepID=UPI0036275728